MSSFTTTQSKASIILGHLRTSNIAIAEASPTDAKWYTMAEQVQTLSNAIPTSKIANLTILANIGCQYVSLQKNVAQQIETSTKVDIQSMLTEIEATLTSGGGNGPYLLGDGSVISTVDLALICALAQPISLLYTIRPYPRLGKWFAACCSLDAVVTVLGDQRALGTKRIGHQIDRRPNPIEAFAAATQSITINKGQKKKETQRQKEKATKKDNKNKKSKESKTQATNETVTQINKTVTEFPTTHEQAHQNLIAAVQKTTTIQEETKQADTVELEVATWAKSLFLKDKKKKKLFMYTTPGDAPSISLKILSKAFGVKELRMAGAKDMKNALGCEKGCVTAMSVVNDCECKVTSVLDVRLVGRQLRMCTGCSDALDHTQHHISEQNHDSLMLFLNECGHSPLMFDSESNSVV